MTRWRVRVHVLAIAALAVGVCAGVLARGAGPVETGADVKRFLAGQPTCGISSSRWTALATVPTAGLLAALPDDAALRSDRHVDLDPDSVLICFPALPRTFIHVGRSAVWVFDDYGLWRRADLAPADAGRVRAALDAAFQLAARGGKP